MNRAARRMGAAALGVACDRALGEPRLGAAHPVALFGRAAGALEARLHPWPPAGATLVPGGIAGSTPGGTAIRHDGRPGLAARPALAGAALAAIGTGGAALAGATLRSTALATYLATAGRALHDAAGTVAAHLDAGDLPAARSALRSLAGRDADALDAAGLARAVVESVAENTVDAVIAPLWWASLLGAPGVAAHRALDTLDSMVGYPDARYARFGTASARADDMAAWVPARLTALLVVAARPSRAAAVARAVRRQAPAHPSPNAGVAEAAFAAALGITLGGPTRYGGVEDHRPRLGEGRPAAGHDIGAAVALSRRVTWLAVFAALGTAAAVEIAARSSAPGRAPS